MTGTCPHGWTYAHNCPTQPAPDLSDTGGIDACSVCGYPEREHVGDGVMVHDFRPAAPDLSDYERATVERIEGAPAAEESYFVRRIVAEELRVAAAELHLNISGRQGLRDRADVLDPPL